MAYWPSVPPCYFPCCTEGEGFFKKVAFFSLFSAHGGHSFLYGFRYPLPTLPRVSSIADRIRTGPYDSMIRSATEIVSLSARLVGWVPGWGAPYAPRYIG